MPEIDTQHGCSQFPLFLYWKKHTKPTTFLVTHLSVNFWHRFFYSQPLMSSTNYQLISFREINISHIQNYIARNDISYSFVTHQNSNDKMQSDSMNKIRFCVWKEE